VQRLPSYISAIKGKRMITSLTMREEVIQGTNEMGGIKISHMKIKKIEGGPM
jgi:hypothetical protein